MSNATLVSTTINGDPVQFACPTGESLMTALTDRYPAFPAMLERGVAVSINGQIFRDDWTQRVPQNAEIFLIPRIEGGLLPSSESCLPEISIAGS